MLYLIRTFGRGKSKTALKIGYTENIQTRLQNYREHNPFFELISCREGDLVLETKLHLFLTARGMREDFLSEWFLDCPEVLLWFHASLREIDKIIWRQRDTLFMRADFKTGKGGIKAKIYESLLLQNKPRILKQIDKEWKIENSQKLLKHMRADTKLLD